MVDPWRDMPWSSLHSKNPTTAGVETVLLTRPGSRSRGRKAGAKDLGFQAPRWPLSRHVAGYYAHLDRAAVCPQL